MKAIVQERFGPPDVLQLVDTDAPFCRGAFAEYARAEAHRSSTGRTRWPAPPAGLRPVEQGHARGKVVITVA